MSRRQTRLTPAEGGRFASPVGSPVPPTAGDLAGMRGDPPPKRGTMTVVVGPMHVRPEVVFALPPKANPTLADRVHLLVEAFPYPPGVAVTGHVDDWRIQLYGSMKGRDRVDSLEVNGEDLDDAAISGVISLVVDKVIGRDPERKTRRYPVFSDLTPARALQVATAPRTSSGEPISGRFPNDADVIAARVLQLMPRYPGYGLAVMHNTGANSGVIIRVALAGRALDQFIPQWELEAYGDGINVDSIVARLACHLDQMTGGHAQPVGAPTPESVAASIRASIPAPNAVSERRYVEVVERPAKPTETLWRLVDSAGRRALAGYPGAKDMAIDQRDHHDLGCTIIVRDTQTGETTTRALRIHPDSIKGYEPGGDVLVETDQLGSIAADWEALLSHAVARRKAKQADIPANLGGPTPEQVEQAMADRSRRWDIDPTPPAASATQIAEAAQRQVLSKACVRANRFHPHLHFAAEPDPRVVGWRVHASDVDHTRHIVITGRDLMVEPTEVIDRRLNELAAMFPVPPPPCTGDTGECDCPTCQMEH